MKAPQHTNPLPHTSLLTPLSVTPLAHTVKVRDGMPFSITMPLQAFASFLCVVRRCQVCYFFPCTPPPPSSWHCGVWGYGLWGWGVWGCGVSGRGV